MNSALLVKMMPAKMALMRWDQPIRYASVSDIGFRRRNNQDSFAVRICSDADTWREHGHLLMVADGMGGHAVGELASKIAADTVCHTFFKIRSAEVPDALKQAFETANAAINERGSLNRDFARMGTTCTAVALCPAGAVIAHVGDSRLYRIRGQRIDQLTADHSVQWELMRQGRLRPDEVFLHESRHVITRSLGPEPVVQVDIEGPYPVLPGDVYLICSDGLTGHVQDAEIGIIASELPPQEACRMLVNLANLRGGSDNITVVIARVSGANEGEIEEEPGPPPPAMGWGWLITIWLLALIFAGGVIGILLGWAVEGVYLVAGAAFAAVGAFAFWLERRPRAKPSSEEGIETTVWRPYRTASARSSVAFLNHLATLEGELARAATEERWSIDWPAQQAAHASAKESLEAKDYPKALAELAQVIDILMAGLLQYRKQVHRQSKWGKQQTPIPNPSAANPSPEKLPGDRGA
jgi:protein phosphatase